MFRTLIGLFLGAAIMSGADISGIWTGVMQDRNGDLQDLSFRFQQRDSALLGKMYGDNESVAITDGTVNGDQIAFTVTTELNGSISKTHYTGTLVSGVLEMSRKRADQPATSPAVQPQSAKPNPKPLFILKRL